MLPTGTDVGGAVPKPTNRSQAARDLLTLGRCQVPTEDGYWIVSLSPTRAELAYRDDSDRPVAVLESREGAGLPNVALGWLQAILDGVQRPPVPKPPLTLRHTWYCQHRTDSSFARRELLAHDWQQAKQLCDPAYKVTGPKWPSKTRPAKDPEE